MHSFRLVLCLAGLATFLLVKYFGEPTPDSARELARAQAMSLRSSASLNSTWSAGPEVLVTNTPRVLLSAVEIGRLEMDGKIVIVARGNEGLVYRVTKPGGEVLIEDVSDAELKELDPELHAKLLTLGPLRKSVMGVEVE